MKYLILQFFLQFLLLDSFSQDNSIDEVKQENIEVQGNISDWYQTNIMVKKGDWISLTVSGIVSVGPFAGDVDGAGNRENPFLVSYSRYKDVPHGALICQNDDTVIAAQTKYEFQSTSHLKQCLSELDFLPDDFTGNLFISKSDQELKFLINDADYSNNAGSFNVSVKIYHNYFAAPGDVVIYHDRNNGGITHSGYVTQIDGCKVIGINCYLQRPPLIKEVLGNKYLVSNDILLTDVNPDTSILTDRFGDWTVYHRPFGRKLKTIWIKSSQLSNPPAEPSIPDQVTEGLTDQNRLIAYFHEYHPITAYDYFVLWYKDFGVNSHNCHGYTFNCINVDEVKYKHWWNPNDYEYEYYEIAGYADKNGDNYVWHISKDNNDQAMAVGFILQDNGYVQVHSEDKDGQPRYKSEY